MQEWPGWGEAARTVWGNLCDLMPQTGSFPFTDLRREIFQLSAAALMYHVNGVPQLVELELLHSTVGDGPREGDPWDPSAVRGAFDPLRLPDLWTPPAKPLATYAAFMHLSSATFRIVTALDLLPKNEFARFRGGARLLIRGKLLEELRQLANLGSVEAVDPSLRLNETGPRLALILAHRDEFGHGERDVSEQERDWNRQRKDDFRPVHWCRIAETQLIFLNHIVNYLRRT